MGLMHKVILFTMLIAAMMSASVQAAEVTHAPSMFGALDPYRMPITDGTLLMVLDLDGDGWEGNLYTFSPYAYNTDNAYSWLWDPDDFVMDRGQIINGDGYLFSKFSTNPSGSDDPYPAGYDGGVDQYYLLWFNTPYDINAAGPGYGVDYGAVNLGPVGTEGVTLMPIIESQRVYLQTTAAPEPVSSTLLFIGAGAM